MADNQGGGRTATLVASAGRLGSRYRESRQSYEPMLRLVLDIAALLSLLRRRSTAGPAAPTMEQR
ncbi:MAG: hypothetical protein ACRDQ1_09905 [Sciscionella sp.]